MCFNVLIMYQMYDYDKYTFIIVYSTMLMSFFAFFNQLFVIDMFCFL